MVWERDQKGFRLGMVGLPVEDHGWVSIEDGKSKWRTRGCRERTEEGHFLFFLERETKNVRKKKL